MIYDIANHSINGISIHVLEDRLMDNIRLNNGYRAACHRCHPTKFFKTFDELQDHDKTKHPYNKGAIV